MKKRYSVARTRDVDTRPLHPEREGRPDGAAPHAGPAAEAAAGGGADQRAELSARDLWGNIRDFGALLMNYG